MHWDYRVMKRLNKIDEWEYSIYEVYYDDKGRVEGWTKDAIAARGETMGEFKDDYKYMKKALSKPVLDYETGKEIK